MPQVRVFADTNVILEAFRTRCWTAITTHFAVETVEKCVEETLTGKTDQIAARIAGAWEYHVPKIGWTCFIEDEDVLAVYKPTGWSAGLPI